MNSKMFGRCAAEETFDPRQRMRLKAMATFTRPPAGMVTDAAVLRILLVIPLLATGTFAQTGSSQPPRPQLNILFVLIDDMGYADFSCFGSTGVKTPNVDRLAAEGVRFTRFYVNAPICSPSRVAFTTGQY